MVHHTRILPPTQRPFPSTKLLPLCSIPLLMERHSSISRLLVGKQIFTRVYLHIYVVPLRMILLQSYWKSNHRCFWEASRWAGRRGSSSRGSFWSGSPVHGIDCSRQSWWKHRLWGSASYSNFWESHIPQLLRSSTGAHTTNWKSSSSNMESIPDSRKATVPKQWKPWLTIKPELYMLRVLATRDTTFQMFLVLQISRIVTGFLL